MMGWNGMMGGNGSGMFLGGFFWLLLLGGLVVGVVWLVRNSGSGGGAGTESAGPQQAQQLKVQRPIEILETRYAKGEIDREEYEEKRRALESTSLMPG